MSEKEATARIKINKLLEAAGWRFFPEGGKPGQHPPRTQRHDQDGRPGRPRRGLREDRARASSTSCCSTPRASRSSSLRPSRRTRTRSSARSRPASTPSRRTAASSSSPTATCTTSGTWSAATPTSSPSFPTPDSVDRLPEGHAQPAAARSTSRSATTTSS